MTSLDKPSRVIKGCSIAVVVATIFAQFALAQAPVQSAATPVEPAATSAQPAAVPLEPTAITSEPAAAPAQPAAVPVEPAAASAQSAAAPSEPAAAPAQSAIPAEPTQPASDRFILREDKMVSQFLLAIAVFFAVIAFLLLVSLPPRNAGDPS